MVSRRPVLLLAVMLCSACTAIAGLDGDYRLGGGGAGTGSEVGGGAAASSSANVGGNGSGAGGSGTGGTGNSSSSSGTGGSAPTCPAGPGPTMLYVVHAAGDYCIDTTEVTSAHYKAFLDSSPSLGSLPTECAWKTGFTPRASGQQCQAKHFEPVGLPNRPVACVDWCDAYAYCAWAGKRLCGRPGGGIYGFADYADASRSEWFHACSDGGQLTFPYGNGYQPLTCVGDDYDGTSGDGSSDDAIDVASAGGCVGGLAQLFDMSGNVWEWENACDPGSDPKQDLCHDRGGSFWDASDLLACADVGPSNHVRSYFNKNIGFRCCADPSP